MSDISIYGMPILSEEEHCNKVPFTKILASTGCDQNGEGFASFIDIDSLNLDPTDIIQIMVDYFNQSGVQVPTAAEVCAYLGSLPQKTPLAGTDKIVLGSCEYGTIADLLTYIQSNLLIKTCEDVIDCVEAEPNLTLQNVSTNNLTIAGELELPDSEVSFTTSGNTATLVIGNQTQTAPIINNNDLSNTGLAITSTVNGIADNIDITSDVQALITSNTDSVTNTVAGHLIATHTAVDNTVVNINETITSTIAVGTGIQTTNEDGSTNIITFPIINAGTPTASMEVRVDGILVTTIPLVQYDIQIDNAGSDFNLIDDQLTFLETNGDTATINFSKYNISASLVTGGIGIYQNGNLIATIPNTASGISIVDVGNYYTSSDVEGALQEIGLALNNTCSGNPLSPTNKLITTDSLTTNATLPANITGTPDTTDANNVFLKAEKRLSTTGCLEDVYVPSQIFTQRQLLTPTAIVTANPLAPTLINSASKDYYRSTVSYTVSVPTGGNYIVDVNACNHTTLIRHNSSGSILGRMVFGMLSFFGNGSDHYPGDIERITGASNVNAGTLSILGGASFSCVHQIDAVVDTGIALLTTTGVIVLPTQYCVATFYPSN